MHDNGLRRHELGAALVETEQQRVIPRGGDGCTLHALLLDAQHVHDVEVGKKRVEVTGALGTEHVGASRQEGTRAHERHLGAHLHERRGKRAHDAGVHGVAHDAHTQAIDVAEPLADGVQVEQGLSGVGVLAVAGVDHAGLGGGGHDVGGAGVLCAADVHVHAHGVERLDGVNEGLALHHRARRARNRERVGTQTLASKLKGALRTRGGLEEQVHHRATAKGRELLDGAGVDFLEGMRAIENLLDVVARKLRSIDEVAHA